MAAINPTVFAQKLLRFYDQQGRKDLPWQQNPTAYRVWVSEIMLQQTQVKTVIPYYQKFMTNFPCVESLAGAHLDDVLHHWAGLGYYSRARNLHACAKQICEIYSGQFPKTLEQIVELPGIGESTGGAILSLAYGLPEAILDGNVKRVLARAFLVDGWYGKASVSKQLWSLSRKVTPKVRTGHFNQAMMDLGASLCSRSKPRCMDCPLVKDCQAHLQSKTAEYPHKKPKKPIPTKNTRMLLIENNKKQIQLLKRPPSGIWGGLYSLPEWNVKPNDESSTRPELNITIAEFKHTFSHFHLKIKVSLAKPAVNITNNIEENQHLTWHNIADLDELAFPTPIRAFLSNYYQEPQE